MNSIEHNPAPLVVDEITLDGKRVQVQSVDLPLDQVTLDPFNPRIANTFSVGTSDFGSELQLKLEALLWDDSDVRDLYRQVLVNHGLIERIIVRQDGRVVEGNCRTVVYRKLREKQPSETCWQQIPARVLPADIGKRDVAILLGEMHVAGKNTWTPVRKGWARLQDAQRVLLSFKMRLRCDSGCRSRRLINSFVRST